MRISYRGWGGHLCTSASCLFRLNTLIEEGDTKVVVSTVGNYIEPLGGKCVAIDASNSRFETMVFYSDMEPPYFDADVSREIRLNCRTRIEMDEEDDNEANKMHEDCVLEVVSLIKQGKI